MYCTCGVCVGCECVLVCVVYVRCVGIWGGFVLAVCVGVCVLYTWGVCLLCVAYMLVCVVYVMYVAPWGECGCASSVAAGRLVPRVPHTRSPF